MNEQMQKAMAQALVEQGYADNVADDGVSLRANDPEQYLDTFGYIEVDPFSDTLEGRRQADALEDWLQLEYAALWRQSSGECDYSNRWPTHEWRLDRIRWCFEQLTKASDDDRD